MRFKYTAVNEAGKRIEGEFTGTEQQALQFVQDRGWALLELTPYKKSTVARFQLDDHALETVFSRLAYLAANGVKVDRAMELLARGKLPENIKILVEDLHTKLQDGQSFRNALREYEDHIDDIFLASIELGEKIGNLSSTFDFIALSLQSRIRLRKDIQKATIYPAAILTFSILAIFFIFNFIVPRITGIFEGAESIPWYTSALISVSNFTIDFQYHILLGSFSVAFLIAWMLKHPQYRMVLNKFLFKLPLVRGNLQQADQIRFCNAMSLALSSGLLVYDALLISAKTIVNPQSQQSLLTAANSIREGKNAAEALINAHFLPDFHASLLEVSQDRASLGIAFSDIGRRLSDEMNESINRMLVLMEPALIGIMGIIIGSIVLVMMLSILSIQNVGF
ncbi:type II secretion system F family protein [Pontibacterium sp.]|uniref:type II secretion system F family protein n=1 Tax=Pontibacterium sp. TaxID=2036026 RepID=UPI0035629EC2